MKLPILFIIKCENYITVKQQVWCIRMHWIEMLSIRLENNSVLGTFSILGLNCGDPARILNGHWEYDSSATLYEDTATLKCDMGYIADDKNAVLTCSSNGEWVNGSHCVGE